MFERTFEDGKYTLSHSDGLNFKALRHGEPWRDLTGDGMVLAMLQEVESLDDKVAEQEKLIKSLQAQLEAARQPLHPGAQAGFTSVAVKLPTLRSDYWYSEELYLVIAGETVLPARFAQGTPKESNTWDISPEGMKHKCWITPERKELIEGVTAWLPMEAVQGSDTYANRLKAHVERFAKSCGWDPAGGEGAFEFIQRTSYRQGWDDGRIEALNGGRRP